jgi:uncharacterized oligopeptide transporter (OPT) family protein
VQELEPVPIDRVTRQLTVRAVLTGMVLGGLLSLCNIYSGLKLGWSNNMSVTAALLGFAFWRVMAATARTQPFTILETNLNQTGASAAASISSAGLVAPIPALTILTGEELGWGVLVAWTFSVCCVGIAVAVGLRRQMIIVDRLPFPSGVAAAQTLREMYASGREAVARVQMLAAAGAVAAAVKLAENAKWFAKVAFPGSYAGASGTVTAKNLTFSFDPTLLMIGVGGLIGLRAGLSLLFGAVVAYAVLGPLALEHGWATAGKPGAAWFGPLNAWLLWPGVAMMVTASLTSFAFSWRSFAAAFRGGGGGGSEESGDVPRSWFLGGMAVALVGSVVLQTALFDIAPHVAALGVLLSFVIAVVAARVAGETNVTPIGPMGKVTQLLFGVLTPGQVAPNLMAANVTGGAASQCADLMHDLKTGWLIGATARYQAISQLCGALAGALLGSAAYLLLIPDPKGMLLTEEWPAPAVATWKAVAEVFARGIDAMPTGAPLGILAGGLAGIALALGDKLLHPRVRRWLPSASAIGLAFVLPAYNSISMCLGAVLVALLGRWVPSWSARFAVVVASGLIAGESLAGVGIALEGMLSR